MICGKRALTVILVASCISVAAFSQSTDKEEETPKILLSVNPFGMLVGLYTGHFEQKTHDRLSYWVEPNYFNIKAGVVGWLVELVATGYRGLEDISPSEIRAFWDAFSYWSTGASAGVNFFPIRSAPIDGYISPGITILYSSMGIASLLTELGPTPPLIFTGITVGVTIGGGYRWAWDWFGLGIEARIGVSYTSYSAKAVFDYFTITDSGLIPSQITYPFSAGLKMYIAL